MKKHYDFIPYEPYKIRKKYSGNNDRVDISTHRLQCVDIFVLLLNKKGYYNK